ncbi:MAG TPA: LamG-like jellyroll fold domain-containing protein [Puia sp.]|jgi:hypothetical protein|nr:LamG-like jellyroll fold domain-containing protein [Puia sp.]
MRNYILFFLTVICLGTVMVSCKKDTKTPDYNANKASLKTLVDSMQHVYDTTVTGNRPGQYDSSARTALKTAIDLASQIISGNTYTQQEVNNAYANLVREGQVFSTQRILEVSPEFLVAQWKFDGDPTDATGHGHDGMLKTGYLGASAATVVDGGVLPQLVTDRFGRANSAYSFDKAALIEVPYARELNPAKLTISMWVSMTANTAGSYMISMNRWNGYKFNLNGTNVPFFTVTSSTGPIYDRDAGGGNLNVSTWTHLAVSYQDGTEKFYVNGQLIKTWTDTKGAAATLASPVNLSIGNEMPKEFYNLTNSADPNYFYGPSYFIGSMDDIRFYNTTLTDAEVLSIYTLEKTL